VSSHVYEQAYIGPFGHTYTECVIQRDSDRRPAMPQELHPNRRSRRDRRSDAESAILAASERLLQDVPVHQLEVRQIIAAAGVSRTSFYMYFSSKFDVIAALLARYYAELDDAADVWVGDGEGPPEARLFEAVSAAGQVWDRHRALICGASESWHADADLGKFYLASVNRVIERFLAAVERDIELGLAHVDGDVRSMISAMVWGAERVFYVASSGANPDIPDLDAAVAAVYRIWATTIYGLPRASAAEG
jgi:TetR/AcrR family transcriptional regulator, ethionamide resistance regulator